MIELLAIHGSARPLGSSRRLMEEVIVGAKEARPDVRERVVRAYEARVAPCIACARCEGEQVGCAVMDDGWSALETALRSADALLIASPVYFMGLPAPLKAIVDRLQAMWWYRERGGRVATNGGPFRRGALVLTAGGDGEEAFTPARRVAKAAFNTLGFEVVGTLLAGGQETPGDLDGRPELLERARELGRRLVQEG